MLHFLLIKVMQNRPFGAENCTTSCWETMRTRSRATRCTRRHRRPRVIRRLSPPSISFSFKPDRELRPQRPSRGAGACSWLQWRPICPRYDCAYSRAARAAASLCLSLSGSGFKKMWFFSRNILLPRRSQRLNQPRRSLRPAQWDRGELRTGVKS